MSKILITGATGYYGKATVDFLLNEIIPDKISVLVRHENKATDLREKGVNIIVADYDDYASLVNAFKGIDKLLFVSGNDLVNRNRQHENVVKAAKEADVKTIIYTSFERKNETENSQIAAIADTHLKTEKWLADSGIPYTLLKNNVYMDVIPMLIGEKILETNTIFFPAGNGRAGVASNPSRATERQ